MSEFVKEALVDDRLEGVINEVLDVLNHHNIPPPRALAVLAAATANVLRQTVGMRVAKLYIANAEKFVEELPSALIEQWAKE